MHSYTQRQSIFMDIEIISWKSSFVFQPSHYIFSCICIWLQLLDETLALYLLLAVLLSACQMSKGAPLAPTLETQSTVDIPQNRDDEH